MMEDGESGPSRRTRSQAQVTRPYEVPLVKRRRRKNQNGQSESDTQPPSEAEELENNMAFFQPDREIEEDSIAAIIPLNNEEEYDRNEGDQTLRNIEVSLADEIRSLGHDQYDLVLNRSLMQQNANQAETTQTLRKSQQQVIPDENDQLIDTVLKKPGKRTTPASPQIQLEEEPRDIFERYMPEKAAENRAHLLNVHARALAPTNACGKAPSLIELEDDESPERQNLQKNTEKERRKCLPRPSRSREQQAQPPTRNNRDTSKPRWHPNLFGSNDWVRTRVQKALMTLRVPEPGYNDEDENEFIHTVMEIRDKLEAKWDEAMQEAEHMTVTTKISELPRALPKQTAWQITPPAVIKPSERRKATKDESWAQDREIERLRKELELSNLRNELAKTKLKEGTTVKTTPNQRTRSVNREKRATLLPPTRKIKLKRPYAFSETEYEEPVPKPPRIPRAVMEQAEEDEDSSSSNDEKASQKNEDQVEEQNVQQALVPYEKWQRSLPKHLQQKPMMFSNKPEDDFNHFINYFENCAKHNSWCEREKVTALSNSLQGDALKWFQQQTIARDRSFQQWKLDMTKAFVNRNTRTAANKFLSNNRFRPAEQSVDDYCRRTVNACERAQPGMDDESKVIHLLDGIRGLDAYSAIAVRPPSNPEKFQELLNNWVQHSDQAAQIASKPIVEIPQTDVEGDDPPRVWTKYNAQIEELETLPLQQSNMYPKGTQQTYSQVQSQRGRNLPSYEFTTYSQNEQFVQAQPAQNGQQMNTPPKQFNPPNNGNGNYQNGQNRPYQQSGNSSYNQGYNNQRYNSNGNTQNSSYSAQNSFSAPRQNGYQNQRGGGYQQNNNSFRQPNNGSWQNNYRQPFGQRNQQYTNRTNGFQNRPNGNGFNNNTRPPFRNQQQMPPRPTINFAAWRREGRTMCRKCGGADHIGSQCESTSPPIPFMVEPTEEMWKFLFQTWPNPPNNNGAYQNGGQSKNQYRR